MAAGGAEPTERVIQRGIMKMLRTVYPRVFSFAIPNGAVLAGNPAQRAKQMGALIGDGLVKGCPDIGCMWTGGGAFMEVKRPSTRKQVSDAQKEVHERLLWMGIPVRVVTSIDEAYVFLREVGGVPWSGIDPRPNANDMWSVG